MNKKIIILVILTLVAILSIFLVAPKASDPKTYKATIEKLDKKQQTVLEMTGTASATSLALGAVPGDATTPIANKIIDLVGYFIIILCVIVLEKYFMTLAGYLTFTWLIPIVCALFAINIFVSRSVLRQIALKILAFGVCIILIVPISVRLGNLIEKANESVIDSKMEGMKKIKEEVEETTEASTEVSKKKKKKEKVEDEKGVFDYINDMKSGLQDLIEDTKENIEENGLTFSQLSEELIEKAKKTVNDFVEIIVIMLVTTCGIPILTCLFLVWFVKLLFSIDIDKLLPKSGVSE